MLLFLPERPSVAIKACCVERVPWRGGTMHKTTHDGAKDSETSLELLAVQRCAHLGVHSLRSLGAPKQGQFIAGKVGIQKGEALEDTIHQALG